MCVFTPNTVIYHTVNMMDTVLMINIILHLIKAHQNRLTSTQTEKQYHQNGDKDEGKAK